MSSPLKPMLAASATPTDPQLEELFLRGPMLGFPKVDGVRAIVQGGVVFARSLKPIRNKAVQAVIGRRHFNGLDGELVWGSPDDDGAFCKSSSGMKKDGGSDFHFLVFDDLSCGHLPYTQRLQRIICKYRWRRDGSYPTGQPVALKPCWVRSLEELKRFEERCLKQGFEGVILRDPQALYKHGRATLNEASMIKIKRFVDGEAEVLEALEMMHNDNPAQRNELGYTQRSHHRAGKRPAGVLGRLRCRDLVTNMEFGIGSGFTQSQRANLWVQRHSLPGQFVKYKHFPNGAKDAPRHPVFLGFRDHIDM